MARITALAVVNQFVAGIRPDSEPVSVLAISATALVALGVEQDEALASAESMHDRIMTAVRRLHDKHLENNSYKVFTFNSSDESFIQGVFFVEPIDDERTRASKLRRAQLLTVRNVIRSLTASEFEALCAAILDKFGPGDVRTTAYRSDQGIDFFVQLAWLPPLLNSSVDIQVFSRFKVWLIGQAKHFPDARMSTPALRELVGSVELARVQAYSLKGDRYPDLRIRLCDPVYYLFFTTGELSSESVELAKRSGLIVLDGFGVAELMAHLELGFEEGVFDPDVLQQLLQRWSRQDGQDGQDGQNGGFAEC